MSRVSTRRAAGATLRTERSTPARDRLQIFRCLFAIAPCLVAALFAVDCGKKGPPLPPLVKLPVPPADFAATRRGDTVDLRLVVPSTNTDNSRPANIVRVDVYAFTGSPTVSAAEVLEHGMRVASVDVKAPRDPDATTDADDAQDPDQTEADVEPPEGRGLDQGVIARVRDTLTMAARSPTVVARSRGSRPVVGEAISRPLLSPSPTAIARTYLGVGVTKKGRRGQPSRRVVVPLVAPPSPPGVPKVTYSETAVTVTWSPAASAAPIQEPSGDDVLPARLLVPSPTLAYHVYDVTPPGAADTRTAATPTPGGPTSGGQDLPLTKTPTTDSHFSDPRITWGAARCYAVRAVETVDALSVESDQTTPACVTLVDTFPPAVPKGLQAVASGEGAINLIWDANTEGDLDGYIVLRGVSPGTSLTRITPMPIHEASFRDSGKPGVRYVYALQAVDKAGNISPMSGRQEETAR